MRRDIILDAAETIVKKKDVLREAGYRYDFERALFINRARRGAFSIEFVGDHSEEELRQLILESGDANAWKFYFNVPPSDGIRRELERLLE